MSSRLTVVDIPKHRFNEVIEHLRFNFFADEPLNSGVRLCKKGESHLELENHCIATLKQGYSRMLISEDGAMAGLSLNGISKNGERDEITRRLTAMDDEKFKVIFGLLYKLNDKVDLFAKYQTDELFECRILSVDEEFRGQGLANILIADTIDIAKRAGFKVPKIHMKNAWDVFLYLLLIFVKVIKADATGIFSQKVFEKHGFKTEAEILYSEIDEDSRPPPPHRAIKLMVKELN